MAKKPLKIVLLVPFSSDDPSRIKIWEHVSKWLQTTLDYPLFIGDYGPENTDQYNHSLARNWAAQRAGDWDVAVFHDADTVLNPQLIQAGVKIAAESGALTYPYNERWELDFEGTKMLLENETSNWQAHMRNYTYTRPLGGCMIIRRDLWDDIRGFDTGFVGWGHEDGAFAIACEKISGKTLIRIPGKSLHLEHVFAPGKHRESPIYHKNKERINRYLAAMRQPNATEHLRALRDESIKIDTAAGINWLARE